MDNYHEIYTKIRIDLGEEPIQIDDIVTFPALDHTYEGVVLAMPNSIDMALKGYVFVGLLPGFERHGVHWLDVATRPKISDQTRDNYKRFTWEAAKKLKLKFVGK